MAYTIESINEDTEFNCYLVKLRLDEAATLVNMGVLPDVEGKFDMAVSIGKAYIQERMVLNLQTEKEALLQEISRLYDEEWNNPDKPDPNPPENTEPRDDLMPS